MKYRFLAAALFVFFSAAVFGAKGPTVVLNKKEVNIAGKKIYLKDVAELRNVSPEDAEKLKALYLKRAAIPGYTVTVTKNLVYNRVKKHFRYIKISGYDRIKVHTEKEIISADEIEETALNYIKKHMKWKEGEASVEVKMRKTEIPVLKGNVLLKVKEDTRLVFKGNIIVPVEIYVDGKFYKIEPVTAEITVNAGVLVAAVQIKRHQQVDSSMVKTVKMDITHVPGDIITDISRLKNMVTTRAVMEGTVLTDAMFERIPLFRRGDTVGVIAVVKGVSVESSGVALDDGRDGDTVKVELITGKTVEGVVNIYGKVVIIKE